MDIPWKHKNKLVAIAKSYNALGEWQNYVYVIDKLCRAVCLHNRALSVCVINP